jgi:hypothetical protein
MTRDDIIKLALEAGWKDLPTVRLAFAGFDLERFFSAAYEAGAAAEREACAKVCDAADKATHPADLADAIRARGEK